MKKIAGKNPSLLEVIHVSPIGGKIDVKTKNYLTLENQVRRYNFLIDIGGNGYSGRLKIIMWSGRPILLVKRRYIEYFYKDMVPYVHYVPVKEDLSDLVSQIQWCRTHPDKANRIGRNARVFAQTHFCLEKILENVYTTAIACRDFNVNKKKQTT